MPAETENAAIPAQTPGPADSSPAARQAVDRIVLAGYPIRLGERSEQHTEELLRELSLLIISRETTNSQLHAPQRLLDLVDMLVSGYSSELEAVRRQREDAIEQGSRTADIVYPAVPGLRKIVDDFERIAVEVDEFCRNGDLLTLATPDELLELRYWTLMEFRRQIEGLPPRPWAGQLS